MTEKFIKELEEKHDVRIIYVIKSGSRLYGTDTPESGTDYMGIFVPSKRSVLLKIDPDEISFSTGDNDSKNTKDDIDIKLFSIYKFFNLLSKGETNAVDLLHSTLADNFHSICVHYVNRYMGLIVDNIHTFRSKNLGAFLGYCNSQAKRYNIRGQRYSELKSLSIRLGTLFIIPDDPVYKYRDIIQDFLSKDKTGKPFEHIRFKVAPGPRKTSDIEYLEVLGKLHACDIKISTLKLRIKEQLNSYGDRVKNNPQGIDFKALSHAMRVILECKEYLNTGYIRFPLAYADEIKAIKAQNVPVDDIMADLEKHLDEVKSILDTSDWDEKVNKKNIQHLLLVIMNKEES